MNLDTLNNINKRIISLSNNDVPIDYIITLTDFGPITNSSSISKQLEDYYNEFEVDEIYGKELMRLGGLIELTYTKLADTLEKLVRDEYNITDDQLEHISSYEHKYRALKHMEDQYNHKYKGFCRREPLKRLLHMMNHPAVSLLISPTDESKLRDILHGINKLNKLYCNKSVGITSREFDDDNSRENILYIYSEIVDKRSKLINELLGKELDLLISLSKDMHSYLDNKK